VESTKNHMAQVGALVGSWTNDTSGETSVGTRMLDETIEKPYSDFLAYTMKVCKGTPSVQRVSGCKG
jgi:hypothetical protein